MYIYLLDLQGHDQLDQLQPEKEKEEEEKEKEKEEEKEEKEEEKEVWEVKMEQSKVKIEILLEEYSYKKGDVGKMEVRMSDQNVFSWIELVFNIKEYNQRMEIRNKNEKLEI